MAVAGGYTAADIQVLTLLQAIRRRPGMYIGGTDRSDNLHAVVLGLVDIAYYEHRSDKATRIEIDIHGDVFAIEHDGRGIAADALEARCTRMVDRHDAYPHCLADFRGIGLPIAAAFSDTFQITTWCDGYESVLRFARGEVLGAVERRGATTRTGIRVELEPDFTILKRLPWDLRRIGRYLQNYAAVAPGLAVRANGTSYHHASMAAYVGDGRHVVEPLELHVIEHDIAIHAALGWHDGPARMTAFVNDAETQGVHVQAFADAVVAAVRSRLKTRVARKRIARGLVAVLHVNVPNYQLDQCHRLVSPEVAVTVQRVIERELARHFDEAPAALDALLLQLQRKVRAWSPRTTRRSRS